MVDGKKMASAAGQWIDKLNSGGGENIINAIDFIEGPGGTGIVLRPVQRVIVKALFNVPFDYRPAWADMYEGWGMVPMWNVYRDELLRTVPEEEYMRICYEEGRCNIKDWRDIKRNFNEAVVFCGRRGGKSEVVAAIAAYKLYLTLLKKSPQQFWGMTEGSAIDFTFLAQDETGAGRLFKKLAAAVSRAQWFRPFLKGSFAKNLQFLSEADRDLAGKKPSVQVFSYPCTTNAVRGPSSIFLALDEFAHFRSEVGSTSEDMYVAATPSAGDFHHDETDADGKVKSMQDSLIISISSPMKRVGMMYELYAKALQDGINEDNPTFCLACSSAEMNPKLNAGFLRDKQSKSPITFKAEYGGKFLESTESFVREMDVKSCCDVKAWGSDGKAVQGQYRVNTTRFSPATLGWRYFWGLDLGGVNVTDPENTKSDATALAIGHIEYRPDPNPVGGLKHGFHLVYDYIDRMIVGEEFQGPGLETLGPSMYGNRYRDFQVLDLKEILLWMKAMNDALPCFKGATDQHAGRQLITLLEQNNVTGMELMNLTPAINSEMAYALRGWINDRTANFPYNEQFIHEIKMVETDVVSKYRIRVHAPIEKGAHDDMVDAVMLVALLAQTWLDEEGRISADPSGISLMIQSQATKPAAPIHNLDGVSMSQLRQLERTRTMGHFGFGGGSHRVPNRGRGGR